jgi:hypothetical protein
MAYDKKKIKRVTINIEYEGDAENQFIEFGAPLYDKLNIVAKDEVLYQRGTRVDGVRRIEETMPTGQQKMAIEIWATHVNDEKKYDSWNRLIEKKKEY